MTNSADRIMQGLKEALDHAAGADVPGLSLHSQCADNRMTLGRV